MLKFLDNANFSGGVNPYGTPANNTYDDQTFFIDRKTLESFEFVEFELASALDLTNRRAPKRIITRKDFLPLVRSDEHLARTSITPC